MRKRICVIGGGTFNYVRNHLALAAPAFGSTARDITQRLETQLSAKDLEEIWAVDLHLTRMANPLSQLTTNEDINNLVSLILQDYNTKVIVFNVALTDYEGQVEELSSGKYAERLRTSFGPRTMTLIPSKKIIERVKHERPDIFLVAFKTTAGQSAFTQQCRGEDLIITSGADIVLVNDVKNKENQIVVKGEDNKIRTITERKSAIRLLVSKIMVTVNATT